MTSFKGAHWCDRSTQQKEEEESPSADRLFPKAAGEVDPTVRAERGIVHAQLRRSAQREAGEQHLAHLRASIAIGVLQPRRIRRGRHDDAAAPAHHAVGKRDAARKLGALVHAPVIVRVLQQRDDAERSAIL